MNANEIVRSIQEVSAGHLTCSNIAHLSKLTAQLNEAVPEARAEYRRYQETIRRQLHIDDGLLRQSVAGKRIMVTGGTGCIGSHLLRRLTDLGAAAVISISRGTIKPAFPVDGVRYECGDVRDEDRITALVRGFQPDTVFHLAAQRNPEVAEREIQRTISTNITGTATVLRVCTEAGVEQFVHASTGKAMRMYSTDVYAASKRIAEWFIAREATKERIICSAARFTHVVDNSNLLAKLHESLADGLMRLHDPNIGFYVQSATESVDLLIAAAGNVHKGKLMIYAIRELGWPVSLLALALGFYQEQGQIAPIYFCGHEKGYERVEAAAIYDPHLSGSVSPLINGFEAVAVQNTSFASLDAFAAQYAYCDGDESLVDNLAAAAEHDVTSSVRMLESTSRYVLDSALKAADREQLRRIAAMCTRGGNESMPHIDERVCYWADA